MKHEEYYTCKRLRMFEYLLQNGFEPESTIHDPTNYKYNWWIFKNSCELEACIEAYFENLNK